MATYNTLTDLFKAICDAIRSKEGTSGNISHQDIPARIAEIQTGIDTNGGTATANDILKGKIAYSQELEIVGTIETVTQPTPTLTKETNSDGSITITATYTPKKGYTSSTTNKSNNMTLSAEEWTLIDTSGNTSTITVVTA